VLAFKDRALAGAVPRCARTAVPADLTGDWAGPLTAAGLDPTAPTGWLAEGFLVYLTAGEAAHVLATATALSAPGSRLCCERGDVTALLRNPAPGGAVSMWRGGLGTDTAGWLRRHDWRPTTHDLAEVSTRYGRPAAPAGGFITAGFRAA
jgi:methyltransferase (TIGR00027 family)